VRRQAVFRALLLLMLLRVDKNAIVKGQAFNLEKFKEMRDKMEVDVSELAAAVEEAYAKRCEANIIYECEKANYLDCIASFPNQECRGGLDYSSPSCDGSGDNNSTAMCSSFYDFSTS
jgi:hypothetical protein